MFRAESIHKVSLGPVAWNVTSGANDAFPDGAPFDAVIIPTHLTHLWSNPAAMLHRAGAGDFAPHRGALRSDIESPSAGGQRSKDRDWKHNPIHTTSASGLCGWRIKVACQNWANAFSALGVGDWVSLGGYNYFSISTCFI